MAHEELGRLRPGRLCRAEGSHPRGRLGHLGQRTDPTHLPARNSNGSREIGELVSRYQVGSFVGSLSSTGMNRVLSRALLQAATDDLEFVEITVRDLPLYSADYDADYPPQARDLKDAIAGVQALPFVTPEYNRSIPGGLKNAIDWGSRPWGQNSFDHVPAAVIGASIGSIGTAVAQRSLRAVLSFCNARQMTAPEAYIHFKPGLFEDDGTINDATTEEFLRGFMAEFRDHLVRVLTVLPRQPT